MKKEMIKTNHANVRQQQRGISNEMLHLLSLFGRCAYVNGAWVTDIDQNGLKKLLKKNPDVNKQQLEKLQKIYLIERSGVVITVAVKRKKWGKKFRRGRCLPRSKFNFRRPR